MKIGFIFIIIGIFLICYSLFLQPFKDMEEFDTRCSALESGQSNEYFQIYDEMLTPKYRLQDTGITIILFSCLIMLLIKMGQGRLYVLPNRLLVGILGFLVPFISVAGFVFDLHQGCLRKEFPSWADSIAIPMIGMPFWYVFLFLVSAINFFVFSILEYQSRPIPTVVFTKINPFILLEGAVVLIIVLLTAYFGQYWFALPGAIWIYYFLMLGTNQGDIENMELVVENTMTEKGIWPF